MTAFEKFRYSSLEDLQDKVKELGLSIDFNKDLSPLKKSVKIGNRELSNPLVIHPMEGCDGQEDGSPSELTLRRYQRFAAGGAGLQWFEATAVVPEGKANPRQLFITAENYHSYQDLVQKARTAAQESMGQEFKPVFIMQLTHSGRYSKPVKERQPIIAFRDPQLDEKAGVALDQAPITDGELDLLQEKYVAAALLAEKAGFDGVDVKACHRYLLSELLAAHTREGKYGGTFENRTRFLRETVRKIRAKVHQDFLITVRLNVFDALPYPYGWGVNKENYLEPDLTEPQELVKLLYQEGVSLVSVSAGNPYYVYPQITRPFDIPIIGANVPTEHPLVSVARLFSLAQEIQKAEPRLAVVGSGYSWLRQYFPFAAASNIAQGKVKLVGVGREAFAYPDFAKDILEKNSLDERKLCLACSKCTQIMRDGGRTGCVIRDKEIYLPIYNQGREGASK